MSPCEVPIDIFLGLLTRISSRVHLKILPENSRSPGICGRVLSRTPSEVHTFGNMCPANFPVNLYINSSSNSYINGFGIFSRSSKIHTEISPQNKFLPNFLRQIRLFLKTSNATTSDFSSNATTFDFSSSLVFLENFSIRSPLRIS